MPFIKNVFLRLNEKEKYVLIRIFPIIPFKKQITFKDFENGQRIVIKESKQYVFKDIYFSKKTL